MELLVMTKKFIFSTTVTTAFCLTFIATLPSCSREKYPDDLTIKFILPEKYEGYFAVLHEKDGESYTLSKGESTISIEVGGHGLVKAADIRFFYSPHITEAEYISGQKLLVHPYDNPKDDENAVRSCTSRSIDDRQEYVYYYGTKQGVSWFRENALSTNIEDLLNNGEPSEKSDNDR